MVPDYATWFLVFARNEMIIAYTNSSKYADEITSENWYEVLNRSDVKIGASDPQRDPCGYRAVMVCMLADVYYGVEVYENVYLRKQERGTLVIRPKSIEIISLLESGEIDYAFLYYSELAGHQELKCVKLPDEINLGNPEYNDFYAQASLMVKGKEVKGQAIMYGVTIPANAENPDLAVEVLEKLLSSFDIFEACYFSRISPAYAYSYGDVPEQLKQYCEDETDYLNELLGE